MVAAGGQRPSRNQNVERQGEVVALAGMNEAARAVVLNQYGMETDMELLAQRVRRPFTRLLVGIEDPSDLAALERVRAALSWPSYPPF
ncbi:hypothetical protein [Roseateles sp. LYH14W]|uniref:Uncharacterized protein n=1 Tax=Pelomonas parva TaxID=3299032 RepID=A0ABW7FBK7_9BURK